LFNLISLTQFSHPLFFW